MILIAENKDASKEKESQVEQVGRERSNRGAEIAKIGLKFGSGGTGSKLRRVNVLLLH